MHPDGIAAAAEVRGDVGRQHPGVRPRDIDVHARLRRQAVQDVVEGDEGCVLFARSERFRIDIRVADAMDHLDFVEENICLSGDCAEPAPEVFAESDRIAQGDVLVLVERQSHDVLRRHARFKKMPTEQVKEQIALSATPNACHDLYQTVPLAIDQFSQILVPLDFHFSPHSKLRKLFLKFENRA